MKESVGRGREGEEGGSVRGRKGRERRGEESRGESVMLLLGLPFRLFLIRVCLAVQVC